MHTASHAAAGGALLAALRLWLMNHPAGLRAASSAPPAVAGILQTSHSSPGGVLRHCLLI